MTKINMGDFPSGQRGQTVNLLATPSVVRIHHRPSYLLCRSGGTGRRPGLKIPWVVIPVPVRFRSAALFFASNSVRIWSIFLFCTKFVPLLFTKKQRQFKNYLFSNRRCFLSSIFLTLIYPEY